MRARVRACVRMCVFFKKRGGLGENVTESVQNALLVFVEFFVSIDEGTKKQNTIYVLCVL